MIATAIVLIIIGILSLVSGIVIIILGQSVDKMVINVSQRFSGRTTGVVENLVKMNESGKTVIVPEVKYSINGYDIHALSLSKSSMFCSYQIGQSVDIMYDPSDPKNVWIPGPINVPQNIFGIASTFFGICVMGFAFFPFLFALIIILLN